MKHILQRTPFMLVSCSDPSLVPQDCICHSSIPQLYSLRPEYILQQFLNQVHVRHEHSSAAVSTAAKFVHRITVRHPLSVLINLTEGRNGDDIPIRHAVIEEFEVGFPEVADHLQKLR